MSLRLLLISVLGVMGAGFLVASVRLILDYRRYLQRRAHALLVWPVPAAPYRATTIALGVVLAGLIAYKLLVLGEQAFGETMMFLYYTYAVPMSRRINRGFYAEGIWADSGFVAYADVDGVTWRDGEEPPVLVVTSKARQLARRLVVPGEHYGAARRLLRDKIGEREVEIGASPLHLIERDRRADV